jgi:hypothetical protein
MPFKIPKGVDKIPMTVRLEELDYKIIEKLSNEGKKSLNEIINMMIKYAIDNMDDETEKFV